MQSREATGRTRRLLLTLYAILAAALIAFGVFSYTSYEASLNEQVHERLAAIASLKTTEISAWRAERIGDGELLQRTPRLGGLVERALSEPDQAAAREELIHWLQQVQKANDYSQVSLVDATGKRVLSASPEGEVVDEGLTREAAEAMATGKVTIADFHRDGSLETPVHLSVAVPIVSEAADGKPIAVIAMRVDPTVFLFPYIQQWPGNSPTAETVLVGRVGDDALFLSQLRHGAAPAASIKVPLTATDVPAVQAALGRTGVMTGVDYQGVPVVAATKPVPDSPWAIVARMDVAEVYTPVRARLRLTIVAEVIILGAGLLGVLHVLGLQSVRLDRERLDDEAKHAWLATAVDSSLSEVYVVDVDKLVFEYVNRGALLNIGYSSEEMSAMSPVDILPELTDESLVAAVRPLLSGEQERTTFKTTHRRKDGSEYPVEAHLQLASREDKQLLLVNVHDITERRTAEAKLLEHQEHLEAEVAERTQELAATNEELATTNEELAAMNEEYEASNEELRSLNAEAIEAARETERLNAALAKADNAKSDFLASMSHELRTPLNSVIGFSDVMLKGLAGGLNEEQHRQMEMINNSGRHLLLLINDVLDLSKIEAGRMEPTPESFDLATEAVRALESLRPQADKSGLRLEAAGTEASCEIVSDCRMVRQILFNLISNAVKFTAAGSVSVEVVERSDSCEVQVTDTGIGIAGEDMARIFDAFTQVGMRNDHPDGTGLGLAVSSRLAQLLGGDLTVQSTLGEGSTFTLTLPKEHKPSGAS